MRSDIGLGLKYHLILYYKSNHKAMDTKLIIILVLFVVLLLMFLLEYGGQNQDSSTESFSGCSCQNRPTVRAATINGSTPYITGQQPMIVKNLKENNQPLMIVPSRTLQIETLQNQNTSPTGSLGQGPDLKPSGSSLITSPNLKPSGSLPITASNPTIPNQSANNVRSNPTTTTTKTTVTNLKTDLKEPGIIKFVFYHMNGCGHCSDFMKVPKENGKTKFELLEAAFANDPKVKIVDFQYGRDKEANKFTAFPMIYILSDKGTQEYNGSLEVSELIKAINKHK